MAATSPRNGGGDDTRVAAVRDQVAAHTPVDDREARARATILRALDELTHPFDEHADPTHVTASAVIVGDRGLLLHRHKRLGMWLQPGGHIDPGESPWDAARREAREETGLACEHVTSPPIVAHVDVHDGGRGHTHLDVRYLLRTGGDDPRPAAGESPMAAWFGWTDAIALADPGLRGYLLYLRTRVLRGSS